MINLELTFDEAQLLADALCDSIYIVRNTEIAPVYERLEEEIDLYIHMSKIDDAMDHRQDQQVREAGK